MSTFELNPDVLKQLVETYGPNPQEVGAKDGTEDDYGDLLGEAAQALGYDVETLSDDDWQRFQSAAHEEQATSMEQWLMLVAARMARRPGAYVDLSGFDLVAIHDLASDRIDNLNDMEWGVLDENDERTLGDARRIVEECGLEMRRRHPELYPKEDQ